MDFLSFHLVFRVYGEKSYAHTYSGSILTLYQINLKRPKLHLAIFWDNHNKS